MYISDLFNSQLARLNAEAAARTKRERRRANEAKTRTIQRMQLQMTAPLDIGLEQQDQTLQLGQDDVFDLEDTKRGLKKKGGVERLMDEAADEDSSEDDDEGEEEEDDEVLDEEEERERKLRALEQDLDGLYESWQERMRERDAKYRVKEARRKDKSREEWGGIRKNDSDDEEGEEGESDEEGGWDKIQARKARVDESSDDDESDVDADEEEVEVTAKAKATQGKKRRAEEVIDLTKGAKKARTNGGGAASLDLSRTAQVWFSQGLFKSAGVDDIVSDEEEDEEEEEGSEEEDVEMDGASESEPETGEVYAHPIILCLVTYNQLQVESDDDDDFEVVPLAQDDGDVDMWDVEDENEDEIKDEKIRSRLFLNCCLNFSLIIPRRARSDHSRSRHTRHTTRQPRKDTNRAHQRRLQPILAQLQRRPALLVP